MSRMIFLSIRQRGFTKCLAALDVAWVATVLVFGDVPGGEDKCGPTVNSSQKANVTGITSMLSKSRVSCDMRMPGISVNKSFC